MKRLLIVDDEALMRRAYLTALNNSQAIIDTVQSLEEAKALLIEKEYRIVISDLRLTGTCGREGLELLQYIREQQLDTRVILVTGYGNFEIMNEAFKLGASFYFEKPVSREALIQALDTLGFP